MLDDPIKDESMKANHDRIKRFYEYSFKIVDFITGAPPAQGSFKGTIAAVYMRAYYCLSSIAKLDNISDFQAVQSTERTLFELYLDIMFLKNNPGSHSMYNDYNRLSLMKHAIHLTKFMDENPSQRLEERYPETRKLATDEGKLDWCRTMLMTYYGLSEDRVRNVAKAIPTNWTALDLSSRVDQLKDPMLTEYYRTEVSESNWHVHGGGSCVGGRTPEMYADNWSSSLESSFNIVCKITCTAFEQLDLLGSVPDLETTLRSFC